MSRLYLLPVSIDDEGDAHLPEMNKVIIGSLRRFIVERTRTARRFIRRQIPDFPIDETQFLELDKHRPGDKRKELIELLKTRQETGLMSESGMPCIADPGSEIVLLAREAGYDIVPVTGPSSLLLGLMASGLNGQHFTFHGYLPLKGRELEEKIKAIGKEVIKDGSTHLFIETPYRNDRLLKSLCAHLNPGLNLCLAIGLTSASEKVITKPVHAWKSQRIGKVPTVFIVGR